VLVTLRPQIPTNVGHDLQALGVMMVLQSQLLRSRMFSTESIRRSQVSVKRKSDHAIMLGFLLSFWVGSRYCMYQVLERLMSIASSNFSSLRILEQH